MSNGRSHITSTMTRFSRLNFSSVLFIFTARLYANLYFYGMPQFLFLISKYVCGFLRLLLHKWPIDFCHVAVARCFQKKFVQYRSLDTHVFNANANAVAHFQFV